MDFARLTLVHCDTPFEILRGAYVRQRFAPHVHDTFAVGVIERGAARSRYRGQDVLHQAGDIVLVEPHEVHTGEPACPDGWDYRMLYLPPDLMARFGSIDGSVPRFRRTALADRDLAARISRLHALLERGGDLLQQGSVLADVIHTLSARYADASSWPDVHIRSSPVVRVRDYIEAHLAEPVTIAALARVAGLSPFHLIREFRRRYGVPPHRYLQLVRIARAKDLLRRGAAVCDVALATGFSDQPHFTRNFRSVVGVPPGRYASETSAKMT